MGPTPCYLHSQVVSACQVLGLVAPLFFLEKVSFLNTERGVAIDTHLKCYTVDTDSKYIWVCGSNFNRSSMNRGYADTQTER